MQSIELYDTITPETEATLSDQSANYGAPCWEIVATEEPHTVLARASSRQVLIDYCKAQGLDLEN